MIELKITADTATGLVTQIAQLAGGMIPKVEDHEPHESGGGLFTPVSEKPNETVVTLNPLADAPEVVEAVFAPEPEEAPEVDKRGIPYNAAFHSNGAKPLNSDGTWKKKRGHDAAALAEYEAQYLNASVPSQEPTDAAPAPAMPSDAAPAMPTDAVPTETTPATEQPTLDAQTVLQVLTGFMASTERTPAYLNELSEHAGVSGVDAWFADGEVLQKVVNKATEDGCKFA